MIPFFSFLSCYVSIGLLVGGIMAIRKQTISSYGFVGMAIITVYCAGVWPKYIYSYAGRQFYYRKTIAAINHLQEVLETEKDINTRERIQAQIVAFQKLNRECKQLVDSFWR